MFRVKKLKRTTVVFLGLSVASAPSISRAQFLSSSHHMDDGSKICKFSDGYELTIRIGEDCFVALKRKEKQTDRPPLMSLPSSPSEQRNVFLNSSEHLIDGSKICRFSDGSVTFIKIGENCLKKITPESYSGATEALISRPTPVTTSYTNLSKRELCNELRRSKKIYSTNQKLILGELERRGKNEASCKSNFWKYVVGAVIVAGAVAAASSGGNSNSYSGSSNGYNNSGGDYNWSWDEIPNEYGLRVWRCRGRQTGRFASDWRCAGKAMLDSTWPG